MKLSVEGRGDEEEEEEEEEEDDDDESNGADCEEEDCSSSAIVECSGVVLGRELSVCCEGSKEDSLLDSS